MAHLFFGFLVLAVVLLIRTIPVGVTLAFVNTFTNKRKRIIAVLLAVHVLFYYIFHVAYLKKWNVLLTIRDIIFTNYTYENMYYLFYSLLGSLVAGILSGYIVKTVCRWCA